MGTARSVEGAINSLRELAQQGKVPDVILLDQQFYRKEAGVDAGHVVDEDAARRFVMQYAKLAKDPELASVLKDTTIITVSGSDDDAYLAELQKISPAVIGRAPKNEVSEQRITILLADTGKIQNNETVEEARKAIMPEEFNLALRSTKNRSDLRKLVSADPLSNEAIIFLGMINDHRTKVGYLPLKTTDSAFHKILKSVDYERLMVSPEWLVADGD